MAEWLRRLTRKFLGRPSPKLAGSALSARLGRIKSLEQEIIRKAAALVAPGSPMFSADLFVLGAISRLLSHAGGFRHLIEARNFPCAASILRMQIDTAMRIHALTLVEDRDETCAAVMAGTKFNTLKDREGKRLSDAHLRAKLAEKNPWISPVYEQTSDFVHLSSRHLYTSIVRTDDENQTAYFSISGTDPPRPEKDYFEVVDAFFDATKLAGTLALAYFTARAEIIRRGKEPGGG